MLRLVPLLVALVSLPAWADEPDYFRRDGGVIGGQRPLPEDLAKADTVWKRELPPGNSSPCVHGDRVFLTTWDADNKELATVALQRASGKVVWRQVAPTEQIETFHPVSSPASSTPACDGQRLFVFFGSCGLLCYDLDGKLLWEHRLGPFQDEFGATSSPVLADGLVILNEDHDVGSFLIAIDQQTGKQIWKTPRKNSTRSYSTPAIWEGERGKQVIVAGSLQMAGYDVATGEKQWWVDGLSRIVDPTPSLADGVAYLATWTPGGDPAERISMEPFAAALAAMDKNRDSKIEISELPTESPVIPRFFRVDLDQDEKLSKTEWEQHARVFERAQNVALAVELGGRGDVTKSHVKWIHRRGLPTVPSSVVYRGVMYMVKDSGIITALDAERGEVLKQGRAAGSGNYYASLVAGDGKVYLTSERGVVTVLKAGRQWELLSSHDFGERIMATPVAADGAFYIRTDAALYCLRKP